MADTPISDLPDAIGLGDDDFLLLSVGDANYKISGHNLKRAIFALSSRDDGDVLTAESVEDVGVAWVAPDRGLHEGGNDVTDLSISATAGDITLYADNDQSVNITGSSGVIINGEGNDGVVIDSDGDGDIVIDARHGTTSLKLWADGASGHHIVMTGLPTTDPGVQGALWNSGGTLKIA
jgi:hypothetical protein